MWNLSRLVYGRDKMTITGKRIKGYRLRSLRLAWHRLTGAKTTRYGGFLVLCDPKRVPRSVATAIVKGTYEAPEMKLVSAAIQHGDRIVELGTGVGVISLLCNRLAGQGNVHSYEANASLKSIIYENFRLNGLEPSLTLKAVTADGQPLDFFHNDNIISSSAYDRGLDADKRTISSVSIHDVVAKHKPTVLVIDIEGGEIDLLPAANLDGVRELIIELHPHIVGENATHEFISSLLKRGFTETGRIEKNIRLTRKK